MKTLITDGQRLVGAKSRFGSSIPVYDDGFGELFIHRDSTGISGIVRAQTWEVAYEICEDEFFPEADETVEQLQAEYGYRRDHKRVVMTPLGERFESEDFPISLNQFMRWETIETPDPTAWMENDLFCEAYGFRPNGPNAKDKLRHGIYAKDLNGDSLDTLTAEFIAELEITLQIED
jgi:hypothetical protein